MFEDYKFEGVSIGIQPILTLYARGQFSYIHSLLTFAIIYT